MNRREVYLCDDDCGEATYAANRIGSIPYCAGESIRADANERQ